MKNQALNFVVDENGVEVITTAQALKRFRKELFERAKKNLQIIKDAIGFILVSELMKASGTDFEGYIERSFDGNIGFNGINGVNDLITLVKTVAMERGITEPCIAYINANGQRLLVTREYGIIAFFNAEIRSTSDYERDGYGEKGSTPYGWRHPSITRYYEREVVKEEEYDYKLVTERILRDSCCCDSHDDDDYYGRHHFDMKKCKGCEFYNRIANDTGIKGRDTIYVRAI